MAKKRRLFLTDYCLTPHVNIPQAGILCEGWKVIGIGGISAFSMDEEGLEVINMEGCYALPGLIDSHIHGGGSFDTEQASLPGQKLQDLSLFLASRGVTSFLPTLVSMEKKQMLQTVSDLAGMLDSPMPGAIPCGIHLEGPFINPVKSGTQRKEACSEVDLVFAAELLDAGRGRIKLLTFAPELENAEKLVELMLDHGVIPSMGHSVADAGTTLRIIDCGARRCTHLYNGLPILHHRESSITDVVLAHDEVSVELILDGAHIEPRIVDLTARIKPKGKLIGVSNSMNFNKDLNKGFYEKDGKIFSEDGVIAGTGMTLDTSWKHLRNYSGMPSNEAAACFTSNPAKDLGLITRGELTPGKRADITFFDSESGKVMMTVANGITVYDAKHNNNKTL